MLVKSSEYCREVNGTVCLLKSSEYYKDVSGTVRLKVSPTEYYNVLKALSLFLGDINKPEGIPFIY